MACHTELQLKSLKKILIAVQYKTGQKAEKIYWRIQNRSGRICAYEPSLGRSRIGALWPVHKVAVSKMGAYILRGRASGTAGSTMDSISHDSTDCKGKSVGCIARQGAVQADTANGAKPQSRGAAIREESRSETAKFAKKGLPNGTKHDIIPRVSGRRAPCQHWDVAKR